MPGIDYGIVGEDEQAAADVVDKFVEVASRQVGTSYAALKKYIAGKHAALGSAIIHQTSGRVSRHVYSLQAGVAEGDDIPVVQVFAQWHRGFRKVEAKHAALPGSLVYPEFVGLVGFGFQPEFL